MDKETALSKIKKCLNLAQSTEPHEAAAGLRQAQKLMKEFNLNQSEILASNVSEVWAKAGAKNRPALHEANLARMIADVFSCEVLFGCQFDQNRQKYIGGYYFVGLNPSPEIAAYSFSVLFKQLQASRRAYIAKELQRYKKNKTAAADLFCQGWVVAAKSVIPLSHRTPEQNAAISAFKEINYSGQSVVVPKQRDLKNKSDIHKLNGYSEGRNANLFVGVNGTESVKLT